MPASYSPSASQDTDTGRPQAKFRRDGRGLFPNTLSPLFMVRGWLSPRKLICRRRSMSPFY